MRAGDDPQAPPVDVLVAAWNRADTINRAITSALAEPEVRSVIVIDDGSTDDTASRAEEIAAVAAGRVVVHRLGANKGPSIARNCGIEISRAPWIAVLDADDFFRPGRTRALLAHARDCDFVADDILRIEMAKIATHEPRSILFDRAFDPWHLDFSTFVLGNCRRRGGAWRELGYFKPLIRRTFLEHHHLRYADNLRLGEDYAFYARALALGARFLVVPACGYVSVSRPDSLSARHSKADLEQLRDSDMKLQREVALSARERRALRRHFRSIDGRVQLLATIEALKARSLVGSLAPFGRSPDVAMFVISQLFQEALRRVRSRLSDRSG
jgi:succinoglycan biosynthesis protein ExoU